MKQLFIETTTEKPAGFQQGMKVHETLHGEKNGDLFPQLHTKGQPENKDV